VNITFTLVDVSYPVYVKTEANNEIFYLLVEDEY